MVGGLEADNHSGGAVAVSTNAFHYRGFAFYWFSRLFNVFSIQIVAVAVGWQLYEETRDPFLLGLVGLVQFAPALVLVLVTGVAADRFSRRRIMGVCIALEALTVAGIVAFWALHERGSGAVWPLFLMLMVFGVARAFLGPAVQSLVANLVPREAFGNAVAWNSSSFQIATISGPALGGLLYGLDPMAPYALAFLLFTVASSLTFHIPKAPQRGGAERPSLSMMLAGLRYIWSQPVVLGAISLDMFAVLLGGTTALLPAIAHDVLDVGPWGLGFLRSATGVGAVLMALYLMRHPIRDRAGYVMFAAVCFYGVFVIVFGLSTTVWLSVVALALIGAADMVSVYIRATLVQLATPDDVRGRVSAVNMLFIGASNDLGEFRAGMSAGLFGVVPAVVLGGAGSLIVAGVWAWLFPDLREKRHLSGR